MKNVLEEAKKSLMHGTNIVLCRITNVEGSCPGKPGAMMVVLPEGKTFGTIGGGALEKFCIEKAVDDFNTRQNFSQVFNLDSSNNEDVSMICGGIVTVDFVYVDANTKPCDLDKIIGYESKPIRVWIFGAGHVGSELCPVLEHLGFEVFMVDNRPEFICPEKHPSASKCILGNYDDISYADIQKADYVCIMTHGHLGDRSVLLQVCRINPDYIGCIGSRKKVALTKEYLRENGIPENVIESVHSPIGIELDGDTPEEIAISIAAQLINQRAQSKKH